MVFDFRFIVKRKFFWLFFCCMMNGIERLLRSGLVIKGWGEHREEIRFEFQ